MAVPKNKTELLQQSKDNYKNLMTYISSLPEELKNKEFPEGTMNRNIRDVLAHLYHWHTLFFKWYEIGMQGKIPKMPDEYFSWRETEQLNQKIWENYQNHRLEDIIEKLNITHIGMITIIKNHTDTELFKKKIYKWIGTSCLATYIRSNCSSHYNWAFKLIKKATIKRLNH
ncbi:hypothetical protein NBRC110019_09690 [Neptunitalea chrysea]|uniref:ClbS/DfsB family four-helix bundle protein n=1 Tax=Neptunitalea chrysea TaxID=1647581 RepID=A0A9W6B5C2_9FLAO|nr:ClbS/DfsB family four-helix bundle protein [Neptunitalea chrysea]GLB51930.1 hypothetical protein NBRC110019_09690 [Neptunitalea chrysea]